MSNEAIVQVFDFEAQDVRVVSRDGEPWFVAKDVAEVLEYSWKGIATVSHIPEQWRGVYSVQTPSGTQEMLCLSEQGLYFFLNRSDKPRALPLQMWVAGTVLPSIRKTGQFEVMPVDPTTLGLPDFNDPGVAAIAWGKQFQRATVAETQVKQLVAQAALDAPRVSFAAAVEAAPSTHLVGHLAKVIQQGTGIQIGQRRLFAWLREHGWLHKDGSQKNEPTQRALDMGLMVLQVRTVGLGGGPEKVTTTPRITGKGHAYFYAKFHAQALVLGLPSQATPPVLPVDPDPDQAPTWDAIFDLN
jgi:anti-repressor protein